MEQDILFWRGQRVAEMSADQLREALAELYRMYERTSLELAKVSKGKVNVA
jgi:hypothetical protein